MKLTKLNLLTSCIFQLLIISVINVSAQDYPIRIVTESFPPYNYVENNKIVGCATDVVREIMRDLNVNYGIKEYPDARLHSMLENEKGIMAYVLFRIPERENKYKWIGPIATDHIHVYKKKGSPLAIYNVDDAKKVKRVAAFHRGVVFDRLVEIGFKNLDETPVVDSIFKKLLLGRVELMVGLPNLGVSYWLKLNGYPADALVPTPVRIETYDMYIVCTKDIPDSVVSKWQKSLDALKASGEFDKIFERYR